MSAARVKTLAVLCTTAGLVALPSAGHAASLGTHGVRVQTVATGLQIPWEIAFMPDRRALVTERPGTVRLLSAGYVRSSRAQTAISTS